DRDIEAIFPQLDRRIGDLSGVDLGKSIIHAFEGKRMKDASIRSTLEKKGWQKGPTGDGGMLESMRLVNQAQNIEAVLELDGVGVGFGWGTEENLGRLCVIRRDRSSKGRWFNFPTGEEDERLVRLRD